MPHGEAVSHFPLTMIKCLYSFPTLEQPMIYPNMDLHVHSAVRKPVLHVVGSQRRAIDLSSKQ